MPNVEYWLLAKLAENRFENTKYAGVSMLIKLRVAKRECGSAVRSKPSHNNPRLGSTLAASLRQWNVQKQPPTANDANMAAVGGRRCRRWGGVNQVRRLLPAQVFDLQGDKHGYCRR